MEYSDFGPSSMAWETIGMDWWQWEDTGGPDPQTTYPINVVVYRGVPLSEVKRLFPVDADAQQDYRYLSYPQAIDYLDRIIGESVSTAITDELRKTRKTIVKRLGTPMSGEHGDVEIEDRQSVGSPANVKDRG